jgi:competence protein ComEC
MFAKHKGEIPVVLLLLPFLCGIVCGFNFFLNINTGWLIVVFFSFCTVFILLNSGYKPLRLYKATWAGGLLITLILFLSGWIRVINYSELNSPDHFSKSRAEYLVVKINNEPVVKNGVLRFTAAVEENIKNKKHSLASGTLLIAIKDSGAKTLYYGDRLLIAASYKTINPTLIPAQFNYKKYLANQNIVYQAYLLPGQYAVINIGAGNTVIAKSLRLRQQLVEKLRRNMTDTGAIAVASTLILGYKADLSNDILQAYSKTGTIHVLSVSGAHVAILYFLLAWCLQFLNRFKYGNLLRAFIIVVIIWYYALLTGFSPAVCRAAIMISMVILGKSYNRNINTLNILAISAFVLLVYNPFFIADVGFQLSYLAVAGLVVLQPLVYKWFTFKNKLADKLWALCSVSIAAQVITFPLSAFYFHQFPVYFLVSNLFIVLPSAIIMYSGLIYLLLPAIPVVSKLLALVLEKTILIMNKVLTVIEHWPFASLNKIWLNIPEYLLLYVIILSIFYYLYDKKAWLIQLGLVCTLLLCISFSVKRINQSATTSIAWLNLYRHPCMVLKNGNNAAVLSDIKPGEKTWLYSIQPYLDSCQVNRVTATEFNRDVNLGWCIKNDNFIQFLNKRIFIFDSTNSVNLLTPKLKTDYIYMMSNKPGLLAGLHNNFDCSLLLISGNNNGRTVDKVKAMAEAEHLNFKILGSNNSLVISSN